jgi:hypothetical protein
MNRIFLGGTCAKTTWRDELIEKMSRGNYEAEWFNPVVKNWTSECQENEENEKNNKCNVHLYVITPEMIGVYSIAEIVNSCWQAQVYGTKVDKVAFYVLGNWDSKVRKSLIATIKLCKLIAPNNFIGDMVDTVDEIFSNLVENEIIKEK